MTTIRAALLAVAAAAFMAACGGDDAPAPGAATTAAGTTTTAAGGTTTTGGGSATTAPAMGPEFSGSASADVTVGDRAVDFEGGRCDVTPDGATFALNIGQSGSQTYFGLLAGKIPFGEEGEPFRAGATNEGIITLVSGDLQASALGASIDVAADTKSGSFSGDAFLATGDSVTVSGTFTC